MPELKKTEEVVKFKEGQKVFVPKNVFAFDTELIEQFNVFQDDGSVAILLVNKDGVISLKPRELIFTDVEMAKAYYLGWLQIMKEKLAEGWKINANHDEKKPQEQPVPEAKL